MVQFRFLTALTLVSAFQITAYGQNQATPQRPPEKPPRIARPVISSDRAVELSFANKAWNQDSLRIETGRLYLIDPKSKKALRLEIQETGPDSGEFRGLYSLDLRGVEFSPEIYVVKDPKVDADKGQPLQKLMETKAIERKPYVLRRNLQGQQSLTVFNSREEAEKIVETYEEKVAAQNRLGVRTAAERVLEAEQLAAVEAERKAREQANRERERERRQLEEQERLKAEERKRQQEAMSAAERAKREADARAFAEAALDFYRVGQFKLANEKFEKAVELDPNNKGYYYQYGVSLYKLEDFNKALVYLRLAEGKGFDPVERDFYVGLCHFRLKEYPRAIQVFQKVEATNHPQLAASGAFYIGMVKFDELRYEEAKEDFSRVLDTSNDPALDRRAEDMMEKIDQILQFAKNKERKFIVTGVIGPQYDSNVLQISDSSSDQGTGSSKASPRMLYGGSLLFRPIYEQQYEFGLKAATNYIYTTDDKLSKYDSWTITVTAPFTFKGTVFSKGYSGQLIPGWERLYLGQDTNGRPKETQNSTLLDSLNTFVLKEDWFSSLNLKYRSDVFKDTPSSDATKLTFSWGNTFFFNQSKTKAVITDIAYTNNNSKGESSRYNRTDFAASYLAPWIWETQFIAGLSAFLLKYDAGTPAREDTTITATATLARPMTEWLKAILNSSYITNNSNITANVYNKFTIGLLLTAEYQF